MRLIFVALMVCLSASGPAHTVDLSGNYAIWGKGRKSCFNYLKDRSANRDEPYRNYIMGYLTAYNALTPETYSISGNMNLDEVMAWLDDYCDTKQMSGLEQSLIEFVGSHHGKRLRIAPGGPGR